MNGIPSHTLAMIIATKFQKGSESQAIGDTPTIPSSWLTAPNSWLYSVRQICSEMNAGMAHGRMIRAR